MISAAVFKFVNLVALLGYLLCIISMFSDWGNGNLKFFLSLLIPTSNLFTKSYIPQYL